MTTTPAGLPDDASRDQIEADIEATRERLAASIEQLAAKADVGARAGGALRRLPAAGRVALLGAVVAALVLIVIRAARRH